MPPHTSEHTFIPSDRPLLDYPSIRDGRLSWPIDGHWSITARWFTSWRNIKLGSAHIRLSIKINATHTFDHLFTVKVTNRVMTYTYSENIIYFSSPKFFVFVWRVRSTCTTASWVGLIRGTECSSRSSQSCNWYIAVLIFLSRVPHPGSCSWIRTCTWSLLLTRMTKSKRLDWSLSRTRIMSA